ncbi:cache domain-containing protein [Pseudoduganella sp. LjRoot289]|uniref:cache domain-containing protein n=1 Tax=Pseudoduganella sp. LjRoot289 TaxID=3342314 RepID=UPI003ECED294
MKRSHLTHMAGALLLAAVLPASAQNASKAEAIALADKAAANIQKKGVEEACKEFADPKGEYIRGELYVVVQDMQCKMVCHALNPKMNGKDMLELKDANGKHFTQQMRDIAAADKTGWVDYVWPNPVSKALEPKSAYVRKANEKTMISVGIYSQK